MIVDNFNRIKAESDGSATMTPEQQQWVSAMKDIHAYKATKQQRPPEHPLRLFAFRIVNSQPFDLFITLVIILNIGAMACDFWGIEHDKDAFGYYNGAMLLFSYIYYCEAVVKLTALGSYYFYDNWCRFDFFLVCSSLLDQFAEELLEQVCDEGTVRSRYGDGMGMTLGHDKCDGAGGSICSLR